MIVPDANLLLYAYNSGSSQHEKAVEWWEGCLSGTEAVGLCGVVLYAFVRIGTSRRAFRRPMSIKEASAHVESWLSRRITDFLLAKEEDLLQALSWLRETEAGDNLTTDAQIAAIARRHRATVHTADLDFQRFRGVRWKNPLEKLGA